LAAATATPLNRFRTDQKSKKRCARSGRRLGAIAVSSKVNSTDKYECQCNSKGK
jgi:hypothetical protein